MGFIAPAIPALIGVGSSVASGVSGKGARKAAEKAEKERRAQLQPLIDSQLRTAFLGEQQLPGAFDMFKQAGARADELGGTALMDYHQLLSDALGKSGEMFEFGKASLGRGKGYFEGAAKGLGELQGFYRRFMNQGAMAIDSFLPGKRQTESLLAPEFANINEGYQATLGGLENAPRGGGRLAAFNQANEKRQSDISKTYFQGRQAIGDKALSAAFQGAAGESNRLGQLLQLGGAESQVGLGQIGAGTSLLGTEGGLAQNAFGQALQALQQKLAATGGLGALAQGATSGANNLYDLFNQQANRNAGVGQAAKAPQKGLGGFLVDLFNTKGVQDKVGGWLGGVFGGKPTGTFPDWWGGD